MELSFNSQQRNILVIGLILSSFLFLQGCSGRKGITIDSEPQGADIVADGKNIGKTPLQIKQDDVFPPRWYGTSYMVKGKLEIQRDGCDSFNMDVNDFILSKDIKANLNCRPGATQSMNQPAPQSDMPKEKGTKAVSEVPAPTPVTAEPASTKPRTADDDIEQRLLRLKDLRDRGVITSKEYADQRKRILDSI